MLPPGIVIVTVILELSKLQGKVWGRTCLYFPDSPNYPFVSNGASGLQKEVIHMPQNLDGERENKWSRVFRISSPEENDTASLTAIFPTKEAAAELSSRKAFCQDSLEPVVPLLWSPFS